MGRRDCRRGDRRRRGRAADRRARRIETVAAAAAAPATFAAPDVLEPAKSALRLKQFEDAAGRLAAEPLASDPRAQYLLGTLYLAGLGVGEDPSRARTLFAGAAAKGEPRAAFALAALAAHDSPVDEVAARTWLAKAAAAGHADAARLLQAGRLPLQVDRSRARNGPVRHVVDDHCGRAPRRRRHAGHALAAPAEGCQRRIPSFGAASRGRVGRRRFGALAGRSRRPGRCDRRAGHHAPDAGGDGRARGCPGQFCCRPKLSVAAVDSLGNSALFYAARRGRLAQAERLVAAGLDPKLRNAGGWSAVDYSVQSEHDAVTGYLVQQGAQPARRHDGSREFRRTAGGPDSAFVGRRCLRRMAGRRARCESQRSGHAEVGAGAGRRPGSNDSGRPASAARRHRRVIARYRRGPAGCRRVTDAPGSRGPLAARRGRQAGPQGNRADAARARRQSQRAWAPTTVRR